MGLSFVDMFRFSKPPTPTPFLILVVSGPFTMKFCTGIDHQIVSSNMIKDLHKINDVIILRLCRLSKNIYLYTQNKNMKNTIYSAINSHIMFNFCTVVAHDKPILHTEQNSEICTDVILLIFQRFRRKALNFKRLYITKVCQKIVYV